MSGRESQGRGRLGRGRGRGSIRGRGRRQKQKADKVPLSSDLSASALPFEPCAAPSQAPQPQQQQPSDDKTDYTKENKLEIKGSNIQKSSHSKSHGVKVKGNRDKLKTKRNNERQKDDNANDKPKLPKVPKDEQRQPQDTADLKKNQYCKNAKETFKDLPVSRDKENGKKNQNRTNTKYKSEDKPRLAPSIPPNQPQLTNDANYAEGESIVVLHVAEKPSIAQAIVNGLAGNSRVESYGKGLPLHEFTGSEFPKARKASKCTHRVTSVAGHVFSVDFPPQYQSWESVDPAELFHAPVVKKANKGSVVKHLQDSARGVNFIVLWMDCDREGENINFEVLDCCMHLMKVGGSSNYDRVYRAHFSAINPQDILKAYGTLGKPDKNQSLSVDARQELDLKVGVAFSRFQTRFFQGRYGDLDSGVLSYGPCQTPTMGFVVQRQMDIETFKPEPYWGLDLGVLKRGRMLRATWGPRRSFNKNKVEALANKCHKLSPTCKITVASIVIKNKKQGRPTPLNTVAMLKACSKALGIGPHAALKSAERLYLSGYLSYPRTESTAYPKSFDIAEALQCQTGDNRWGSYVSSLLREGPTQSRGGIDMGDHPPITPCRAACHGELVGDMARVYDLVTRHFIASVSQDAVWRSTRVDFKIKELGDQGIFVISGKEPVSAGFLAIRLHGEYGEEVGNGGVGDDEEERAIPEFTKGEEIPIFHSSYQSIDSKVALTSGAPCWASLTTKERMTTPPTNITESELITKMEKYAIGTDASIATHIENVIKRNYVYLESGRKLCPSKLGLVLVRGYHQIDESLVLPKVRSDIEDQCNRIAKGLASRDDVVKRAIEVFAGKFDYFVKNIDKMDVLFSSSFAILEDIGKPFTRCGLSMRYLQYISGPPPRLYNKYTETVYPLPVGGIIKQWTGRKCSVPECNFELCLYSVGQPQRTFPLCPYCFNNPRPEWGKIPGEADHGHATDGVDREDENKERQIRRIGGNSLILECPMPDKHPLIAELAVSPDPDSDGAFILDPNLGPKWRLVSTREPTIIFLPKGIIEKVAVLDQKDIVLGCNLMQIDFKAAESPLEDRKTKHVCCFPVDELIQEMVRVHHGSERTKASGRGSGRGGRGRGGRGRG